MKALFALFCLAGEMAYAQTAITASGLNTSVGAPVLDSGSGQTIHNIGGGTRQGENLFHSFDQFSVTPSHVANFLRDPNATERTNILARVTGSSISNIDGVIRTTDFARADLYLLNPNGVIFGPNASLDVSGSFHAGTANFIALDGENRFYADPDELSSLTTAPPSGFGFLEGRTGSIEINNSALAIPAPAGADRSSWKILLLEAKEIEITGAKLSAATIRADRIEIRGASFEFSGVPDGDTNSNAFNFNRRNTRISADVVNADVAGSFSMDHGARIRDAQDKVEIKAANVELTNNSSIEALTGITVTVDSLNIESGGRISAASAGDSVRSGDITINANVEVIVSGSFFKPSVDALVGSEIDVSKSGGGAAGTISISAPSITVKDNASIEATTSGFGFDEEENRVGDINLEVDRLVVTDGGQITNSAFGAAISGSVVISASETVDISGESENRPSGIRSETQQQGDFLSARGGSIEITSPNVKLSNKGFISARTVTSGGGGAITINAGSGTVAISGLGSTITTESVENQLNNAGSGGNIKITAGQFVVEDHGQVTTGTSTTGDAGKLSVAVDSLILQDGASITADTSANGIGGNIKIDAREVELSNGASVSATSTDEVVNLEKTPNEGRSGNIMITGLENLRLSDSTIEVKTAESNAGNITIDAAGVIRLTNESTISTEAAVDPEGQGTGNGGNIKIGATIGPRVVVLDADSEILARAKKDNGGRIDIIADFFIGPVENVDASSTEGGIDGEVDITGEVEVIGGTIPLQEGYLDATALLDKPCAARTGGASSLVALDSRGLPANPDNLLPAATPVSSEAHQVAQNNPRSASRVERAKSLQPTELLLAGCQ